MRFQLKLVTDAAVVACVNAIDWGLTVLRAGLGDAGTINRPAVSVTCHLAEQLTMQLSSVEAGSWRVSNAVSHFPGTTR